MIVGLRLVVSPRSDAEPVLQFREENGDWQTVPTVVLRVRGHMGSTVDGGFDDHDEPTEDTARGDSKPEVQR